MAANVKKSGKTGAGKFFRDIRTELRKIVWPTRKELINYTIVVIVFSLLIAFFIGFIDLGFSAGYRFLAK